MPGKVARSERRLSHRVPAGAAVVAGALLLTVLGWFALFQVIDQEESQDIESAKLANANLVRAFNEHVLHTLNVIDLESMTLAGALERQGPAGVDLPAYRRRIAHALPYVLHIAFVDAAGHVASSSLPMPAARPYAGDQDYFSALRAGGANSLTVGQPGLDPAGKRSIPLARRVDAADGGFGGVLVFSIDPTYFSQFFAAASLGAHGAVTLFRDDGVVVARRAGQGRTIGMSISQTSSFAIMRRQPKGAFVAMWAIDGVSRVVAFERVRGYPLTINVSSSVDDVLAQVRDKRPTYYLFAVSATLFLLLASVLIAFLFHRREQAARELVAARESAERLLKGNQQALVELTRSEARFRAFTDLSSDWYCELDDRFRFKSASANTAKTVRMDIGSIIGMHPWEASDWELADEELEAHKATLRAHQPFRDFEFWRRIRDGRRICTSTSGHPMFDAEGKFAGYRVVGQDITERKRAEQAMRESEERFRSLLTASSDGVWIHRDARLEYVNYALVRMLGYDRADEIIGRQVYEMMHPGEREVLRERAEWVASTRRATPIVQTVMLRRDGSSLEVETTAASFRQNEATWIISIVRDITQRKRVEAELKRLNAELELRVARRTAELEQANRELEAFSYSVSHDLRGPLRAITGFGAILMTEGGDKLDPKMQGYLQRTQAAAERMGMLIDDLLALSRISRHEMKRQPVDLSSLAGKVAESLIQAHPARKVQLSVAPGMKVQGDPGLIRILLENLIGNAWKFTSHTEAAVIEVGATENEGRWSYSVRDNGAGFDMRYAGKLFGAFQRLHSQSEFEGTGIGLSIVQRIVDRHGGMVWAEGKVHAGATFHFTLE